MAYPHKRRERPQISMYDQWLMNLLYKNALCRRPRPVHSIANGRCWVLHHLCPHHRHSLTRSATPSLFILCLQKDDAP